MSNLIGPVQVKCGISTNDNSLKSMDVASEMPTVTEDSIPEPSERVT